MICSAILVASMSLNAALLFSQQEQSAHPSFDYEVSQKHEIKPHRRTVPLDGIEAGFNQLHLTLTVSPMGDVLDAKADGESKLMKFWPELEIEVRQWKFTPFEKDGKPITAEVEEYLDLVPPERLPKKHIAAPVVRPNSKVAITLQRTGCFGSCPSYKVAVTTEGIFFDGGYVVAAGKHRDIVDPQKVREFARRFIVADFYSMNEVYRAGVTDNPTYVLSISIDGRMKEVVDYVGEWEGMPAVITELEDAVDEFAQTQRWIKGSGALVEGLTAERYNFKTFDAQVMLKEAASRGDADSVRSLLEAGVPLKPMSAPKPKDAYQLPPFKDVGWLNAASGDPETLRVLIEAEASKDDQSDKDLALAGAARSGKIEAVRELIAYGANPNADLSSQVVTESSGGMTIGGGGAGGILIYAAESGNPEVVRTVLGYHPKLEARGFQGKTSMFFAGDYRNNDADGARVECVRLLAAAGADVNARDNDGNTPLHGIFLTDVEEELLKLGADVNARNKDGETPIFTNVDNDSVALFIAHGADLTIRNKKGQTVVEAAEEKGPLRQEALRKAIENLQKQ